MKIKPPGVPCSVLTRDNVETLRSSLSSKRQLWVCVIDRYNAFCMTTWKIMIVQQLPKRILNGAESFIQDCAPFLLMTPMLCHGWFPFDGYANNRKCRYWVAENPRELNQRRNTCHSDAQLSRERQQMCEREEWRNLTDIINLKVHYYYLILL